MIRAGRLGVVVLDHARAADAERAAASARDPTLAPRVLIVDNGTPGGPPSAPGRLRLGVNGGFGAGMNAGIEELRAEGCAHFLLMNSDAVLEPGCLPALAAALEDPELAAVGPVVISESTGLVESRGLRVDLRWGRVRLEGHGRPPENRHGVTRAEALSGAVMMLSGAAIERVGLLDVEGFFGFEDVDWCLRARGAGFALGVVEGARARHAGSATIGRASADRFYYATGNHLRCVERHEPRAGPWGVVRRTVILGLNVAHALRQREVPRRAALRAVRDGWRDVLAGRLGPRPRGPRPRAD